MPRLNREEILALSQSTPELKPVEIPEWGGTYYLRPMTARRRERLEAAIKAGNSAEIRARTAVYCLCDESGELIFQEEDVTTINDLPMQGLMTIYEASESVNAVSRAELENLVKN